MVRKVNGHDIGRLMMGDQCVFEEIYQLYSGKVYRLAFRFLKNTELSQEIVQETFMNLWLNKEKVDPNGNIWLFLFVISKRLSINALRNIAKSKYHTENLLLYFNELQNYTEEDIFVRDLELVAKKVIGDLPRQQQIIYKLSRIEGYSHKKIADQLNISANTVKNHMSTALKTIKSRLSEYELMCLFLTLFLF